MAHPNEKLHGVNYEEYQTGTPDYGSHDVPIVPEYTAKEKASILRKIDLRLVVLVGFMYCVSLMDRTNLGNAKAAGMGNWPTGEDKYGKNCAKGMTLGVKGGAPLFPGIFEMSSGQFAPLKKICYPNGVSKSWLDNNNGLSLTNTERYSIMTLVFFPTYIIFQIPSTVIVRKLGPRLHLSSITILWGGIMIIMAFIRDWKAMAGMRVVLGVLEAGFFPSCVYLLSTWYPRYEMGKRYSLFYLLGCVASAFAGVLAGGLTKLHTKAGLAGWQWIFLVEGILTVAVGGLGAILLVGFPDHWTPKWKFLTEREVRWVIDAVNKDRGDATVEPFAISKFLRPALDWKIWIYALLFFNTTTISYALAYFLPTILNGMGYDHFMSQIMGAPPYVLAGIVMAFCGWAGDKWRVRGPLIIMNMTLCVSGLCLMYFPPATATGVKLFGIFLVAAGANANIPVIMTYQANNIRGQWKRAFCSASMVGFGGLGGIAGSLLFKETEAQAGYPTGMKATIIMSSSNIVLVVLLAWRLNAANKKSRAGQLRIEGAEDGFLYTL